MQTPRVVVNNQYRRERVNLQPYGNTISVETTEDNPFTQAQDVEVVTQGITGMAGPDPAMRSRQVKRHPTQGTVMRTGGKPTARPVPGRVSAQRFTAPAHRPHGGFVPGLGRLGDDASDAQAAAQAAIMPPQQYGPPSPAPAAAAAPSTSVWGSIANAIGVGAGATSNVLTSRYNSEAESAKAKAAAAQAQSQASKTEASRITAMLDQNMMSMGQHKTLVFGLVAVGVIAIGAAFLLKGKKKGKRLGHADRPDRRTRHRSLDRDQRGRERRRQALRPDRRAA